MVIKWFLQRFFGHEQLDISFLSAQAKQEVNLRAVVYEAQVSKLEQVYVFRNSDEIREFLFEHKTIISVLLDARPVLEEFFTDRVVVSLELVDDLEISAEKQLFGYIDVAGSSPVDAFERLSAFDSAWFLKQFDFTSGLFNFSLE
jgi:hypothetical protein